MTDTTNDVTLVTAQMGDLSKIIHQYLHACIHTYCIVKLIIIAYRFDIARITTRTPKTTHITSKITTKMIITIAPAQNKDRYK